VSELKQRTLDEDQALQEDAVGDHASGGIVGAGGWWFPRTSSGRIRSRT